MMPEEIQQVEADRAKKAAAWKHALEAEDCARKRDAGAARPVRLLAQHGTGQRFKLEPKYQ